MFAGRSFLLCSGDAGSVCAARQEDTLLSGEKLVTHRFASTLTLTTHTSQLTDARKALRHFDAWLSGFQCGHEFLQTNFV